MHITFLAALTSAAYAICILFQSDILSSQHVGHRHCPKFRTHEVHAWKETKCTTPSVSHVMHYAARQHRTPALWSDRVSVVCEIFAAKQINLATLVTQSPLLVKQDYSMVTETFFSVAIPDAMASLWHSNGHP